MPRELLAVGIFVAGALLALSSESFRPNDWRLTVGVGLIAVAAYAYGKLRSGRIIK